MILIARVFARLDAKHFEQCFLAWIESLSEQVEGVVAIDGKTSRRSHDRGNGKKALQRVACMGGRESLGAGTSRGG
jgi:hypothetical protein